MLTRRMSRAILATVFCAASFAPLSSVGGQMLAAPTATSTVAEVNAYFDQMAMSIETQYAKLIKACDDALLAQQAALVALQAIPPRIPDLQNKIAVANEALGNLPAPFLLFPDPVTEAKRRALTEQIAMFSAQLATEQANLPRVMKQIEAAQAQIVALPKEAAQLLADKQTALRNLQAQRNKALLAAQQAVTRDQAVRAKTLAVPPKIP